MKCSYLWSFYQLLHCAHMCKWSPEDYQAKTQAVPFSANGYRFVVEEMTILWSGAA